MGWSVLYPGSMTAVGTWNLPEGPDSWIREPVNVDAVIDLCRAARDARVRRFSGKSL